jgi:hypothetical protein
VRAYFQDTHNVAEGPALPPLPGPCKSALAWPAKRVAVILSGGIIDALVYRRILAGETPQDRLTAWKSTPHTVRRELPARIRTLEQSGAISMSCDQELARCLERVRSALGHV